MAVFQDFQQVTALLCVQFDQVPVIEDEGLGICQGGGALDPGPFAASCHDLEYQGGELPAEGETQGGVVGRAPVMKPEQLPDTD